MTRKDFRQLAQALRGTRPDATDGRYAQITQWEFTRSAIADVCQEAHPRFSRALFIQETNRDAS